MFPYSDPQIWLDVHHRHVAEMIREADDYRRARASGRRSGRWRRGRPSEVAAE